MFGNPDETLALVFEILLQEMEAGDTPTDQRDEERQEEDTFKLKMENSVPVRSPRPVQTRHTPKKLEDFVL